MVRRKARMKRDAEQAGIVPALALVAEVEHEFFFRRAGRILKRPDAAFAFPDAQFIRAGNGREADGVGEQQIGEGHDRRPVAGNGRRHFGHHAIEKGPDGRAVGEAIGFFEDDGFGSCRQNQTAQQSEGQQPLAVFEKSLNHNRDSA